MKTKILGMFVLGLLSTAAALPAGANTYKYYADLSGPAEAPPNASPGTGWAWVTIDDAAFTMRVESTFSGLLGNTTASHIHCCTAVANSGTAGVVTQTPSFGGFPLGVTAGSYDNTFDMLLAASYNPAFLNNAINAGSTSTAFATLLGGLNAGKAYFNIHTQSFPGGEIRGFLAVPEPGTLALLGLGLAGLGLSRRRKAD